MSSGEGQKWDVNPLGSVQGGSMTGSIELGRNDGQAKFEVRQDVSGILKEIERDRYIAGVSKVKGMRKMCTIPDIVAIEILEKWDLDLHSPDFMSNPANMTKLRNILVHHYPKLLIQT